MERGHKKRLEGGTGERKRECERERGRLALQELHVLGS